MSDWENDDDWANPPPKPPPVARTQNYADEWDDGPTQNASIQHERDHSSSRNSDRRSNHSQRDRNDRREDEELVFTVNKSNVGLVIGRGGSKIKELEQNFHVRLNIGKSAIFFVKSLWEIVQKFHVIVCRQRR